MNKILIISSEYTGHGHKSVHTAIIQGFEKLYKGKIECKVINGFVLADKKISSLEKLYNPCVKYFPDMWSKLFLLSDKNVRFFNKNISKSIEKELVKEKLELNKKTNIYKLSSGFTFIGYRFILRNNKLIIRINNKVKTRIKRKIKYLSIYDKDKLVRVKASYYGYMKRASTNYLQYKFKIKS